MKKNPTPEEVADEEARTTPMGLFHTACSYHLAARELEKLHLRSRFADMPVRLLYFHTIDLFLKSFLRLTMSAAKLGSREFGHQLPKLARAAKENKLVIPKRDMAVIDLCDLDIVFGSRYPKIGFYRLPRNEDLLAICGRLRKRTCGKLRKKKVMVRP
jgi:hypothetical protein